MSFEKEIVPIVFCAFADTDIIITRVSRSFFIVFNAYLIKPNDLFTLFIAF